ncbi:MAG: type II toxin-antitoxin system RelE/ParE family toxin [Rhizobiaceae bacterium]
MLTFPAPSLLTLTKNHRDHFTKINRSRPYVLHAFQKKTEKTAGREVDLAKKRFLELTRNLK